MSTCLENDEAVTNCLSTIRESEQKAGEIAKTITQLKCELHSLQTVRRFDNIIIKKNITIENNV